MLLLSMAIIFTGRTGRIKGYSVLRRVTLRKLTSSASTSAAYVTFMLLPRSVKKVKQSFPTVLVLEAKLYQISRKISLFL